jgi:hypothetical protein
MTSQDSQGRKLLYIVSTVAHLPITGVEGHYPICYTLVGAGTECLCTTCLWPGPSWENRRQG